MSAVDDKLREWWEAKVQRLEAELQKEQREIARWIRDCQSLIKELNAANQLLEQTIEVLEEFDWTWLKHEPEWAEGFEWLKDRMDPLLGNLKERKP